VVADGIVYVGSSAQRRLFAFDATGCGAATCDPLWTTDNLRGPPRSSPSIANGVVYAVDRTGLIHAFDAATGATVWTYDTGFAEYPSGGGWVTVSDGVLYAAVVFAFGLYAFGLMP
jgi:outer membrane protein assembly factor BamB